LASTTINPILTAYSTVEAWTYGLSSAISKLGFVIGVLGSFTVCCAVAAGIRTHTTKREFLEQFTTAIRHKLPERLFDLYSKQVGKARFMIKNNKDAEFEFKGGGETV
jgi:hypothetical protein